MVKRGKIRKFLLIGWMISAIADCMIYLPVLHRKIQVFEIIFCIFLLSGARSILASLQKPFPLKWPLLAFAFLAVLNTLLHWESQVLLENSGTLYACMIPFVFSHALFNTDAPGKVIEKGFLGGIILLLLMCLAGLILHYVGWISDMVLVYEGYPYLGTVVRVTGLTNSPNKVVAFAAVGIYFLLYQDTRLSKNVKFLLILSLLVTAFLTYSKEIVIVFFVPIILYLQKRRRSRYLSYVALVAFIVSIVSLTYFYLAKDENLPEREDVVSSEKVADFSVISVYPTAYYFLFRSSLIMAKEHPVSGVGFGNYLQTIEAHKKRGFYPTTLDVYEAHDNYSGLVAQYGMGYLILIVWFIFAFWNLQKQLPPVEGQFVGAVLLFFFLFGFVYFSYHMRFMWMFFGLVQIYALQTKR